MSVRILVDGLGDVAPVANWDLTEFNVAANGETNLSQIVLRDFEPIPTSYIAGKRVTVDRGPGTETMFGGYVWKSGRGFWFPVDDPTRLHRQWRLSVVDNNVLFSKRVVFKKADIANPVGPKYGTYGANECLTPSVVAYDDDVIANLVANYLDLSTDSLDTVSKVIRVANIYYGQPTYPYNGGDTFGDAMAAISQIPAAVYCIDPDWALVYHDVDLETAPFALSDRYLADGAKGYRECTVWTDGSQLANDFMGWGAGQGADNMVFQRIRDAASISAHRLWQDATTRYDVWCQGTMDRIVLSAVDGSPTSQRGHKDDILAVDIATYENGLRVAQGVHFINHEYGIDMVLPIRKMRIGFDGPDTPRYDLHLAHVVDRWGFADPPPPLDYGGGGTVVVPGVTRPKTGGGCVCGIFDTFTRTVASGAWGIPDVGPDYTWLYAVYGGAARGFVDGSRGVLVAPTASNIWVQQAIPLNNYSAWPLPGDLYFDLEFANVPADIVGQQARFAVAVESFTNTQIQMWPNRSLAQISSGYTSASPSAQAFATQSSRMSMHVQVDAAGIRANIWAYGAAEPVTWTLSDTWRRPSPYDEQGIQLGFNMQETSGLVGDFTAYIDNIRVIPATGEIDKCSAYRFDNFNRTAASGWGTSDFGSAWSYQNFGGGTDVAWVDGANGLFTMGSVPSGGRMTITPGPFQLSSWTMRARVQWSGWGTGAGAVWFFGIQDSLGHRKTFTIGKAEFSADPYSYIQVDDSSGGMYPSSGGYCDVILVPGLWYTCEWSFVAGGPMQGRIWADGDAVPGWQAVGDGDPGTSIDPTTAQFLSFPRGHGLTYTIDYIDFDYAGKPCYVSGGVPVYPPPGISPPLSGKFCETVSGNLATYALSRPFVPGSIDLFANGVYQVEGVDYTDVPGAGTVTFPATASRTLDVCYLIA